MYYIIIGFPRSVPLGVMHLSNIFFSFITTLLIQISDSRDTILDVVSPKGTDEPSHFCVQYNYDNQTKTPLQSAEEADTYYVEDLTPINGCSQKDYNGTRFNHSMTMIIILGGNCDTVQQATIAEKQGASAVIVVSKNENVSVPSGSGFKFKVLTINVFTISQDDFKILSSMTKTGIVQVKVFKSYTLVWDYSVLVMAFMTTVLVILGGMWAASEKNELLLIQNKEKSENADKNQSNITEDIDDELIQSQWQQLGDFCILMVIITCSVIFIINFTLYLTITLFCIVGMVSIYNCLRQFIKVQFPKKCHALGYHKVKRKNSLKVALGPFLLFSTAVAFVITWLTIRTTSSSWILQNVIGATICVDGSRIIAQKYKTLVSITKLISLFLLYDQVISLIIPPSLTDGGDTVIETLTTGGNEEFTSLFPIMFRIPQFEARHFPGCGPEPYTVLNYWYCIIGGVFVSFCAICDIQCVENCRQQDQWTQQHNTQIDPGDQPGPVELQTLGQSSNISPELVSGPGEHTRRQSINVGPLQQQTRRQSINVGPQELPGPVEQNTRRQSIIVGSEGLSGPGQQTRRQSINIGPQLLSGQIEQYKQQQSGIIAQEGLSGPLQQHIRRQSINIGPERLSGPLQQQTQRQSINIGQEGLSGPLQQQTQRQSINIGPELLSGAVDQQTRRQSINIGPEGLSGPLQQQTKRQSINIGPEGLSGTVDQHIRRQSINIGPEGLSGPPQQHTQQENIKVDQTEDQVGQQTQQENIQIGSVEQHGQQHDLEKQKPRRLKKTHYMLASSVGYSFGVIASYGAWGFLNVVLPKSTFIVPFTVVGLLLLAKFRGEVRYLYSGELFNVQKPASINTTQVENDDKDDGDEIEVITFEFVKKKQEEGSEVDAMSYTKSSSGSGKGSTATGTKESDKGSNDTKESDKVSTITSTDSGKASDRKK